MQNADWGEMTLVMMSLPLARVFQCLHLSLFPLSTDWEKSGSSVNREPQGNLRWKSNSRDAVASSPSFFPLVARVPRRACSVDSWSIVGQYFADGSTTDCSHVNDTWPTQWSIPRSTCGLIHQESGGLLSPDCRSRVGCILTDMWPILDCYSLSVDSRLPLCWWITDRSSTYNRHLVNATAYT